MISISNAIFGAVSICGTIVREQTLAGIQAIGCRIGIGVSNAQETFFTGTLAYALLLGFGLIAA